MIIDEAVISELREIECGRVRLSLAAGLYELTASERRLTASERIAALRGMYEERDRVLRRLPSHESRLVHSAIARAEAECSVWREYAASDSFVSEVAS